MPLDKDLASIQEARDLARRAREALATLKTISQEQTDRIVAAMAQAGRREAERLARMAVEETGFGVYESKVAKNLFASERVYEAIKNIPTVGIIAEDRARKIVEIAEPVGVVQGITPVTNPTSTVLFKSLVALKARNPIVFSPHPAALECSREAARVMAEAAVAAGAPEDSVACMSLVTLEGTQALMRCPEVALILATGGMDMVRQAYSSGKPAVGVGPGNVPAFIERTADVPKAVADIVASQTFDNGTVCSSEQAVIADAPVAAAVRAEFERQGAYFLSPAETAALGPVVVLPSGLISGRVVGRPPERLAELAGFSVPPGTKVLIAELPGVGPEYPLSREKLCPILAFYQEDGWLAACERCIELLELGGMGHTLAIHSRDESVIMEFALQKPIFRILVNTPTSQGAIGLSTSLDPSLTLATGTWGGSSTSDNVGPRHLINIKRLAYETNPVRAAAPETEAPEATGPQASRARSSIPRPGSPEEERRLEEIARQVLAKLEG